MTPLDDRALLREYARTGAESAFAPLVERYVALVFSAARRQLHGLPLAEDVTQSVFIALAKKADEVSRHPSVSGWLLQATRYAANAEIRAEVRRVRREQEALMQSKLNESSAETWSRLEPLLDEAMASLGETDRAAVALRYFENRTAAEIGLALQVHEEAAKKRVTRAVDKMRKIFSRRGVTLPATVLGAAIAANSVQAAPTGLAQAATTAALAKGSVASVSTAAILKGTAKVIWPKISALVGALLANVVLSQEVVASHFDFAGRPNAWMTRSHYTVIAILVGVGMPLFLIGVGYGIRFLPVTRFTFKIPNREYWLTPERKGAVCEYLFRHYLWMAVFQAIFTLVIQILVVAANHQNPPHFSSPLGLAAGAAYFIVVGVSLGVMVRHFKRIPNAR